jgi:hypothetical protein
MNNPQHRVLQGSTWFYWVLLGSVLGFRRVRVLQGSGSPGFRFSRVQVRSPREPRRTENLVEPKNLVEPLRTEPCRTP